MPKAGGLPDVTQRFLADNIDYLKKAGENVQASLLMAKANEGAVKTFNEQNQMLLEVAAAYSRASNEIRINENYVVSAAKSYDTLNESVKRYADSVRSIPTENNAAQFAAQHQQAIQQLGTKTAAMLQDIKQARVTSLNETATAYAESFNKQVAAVADMAGRIKQAQIVSVSETQAAYAQAHTERINQLHEQAIAEQKLQTEIEKTGDILDRRVASGRNIVPSVIAQRDARDIRIDSTANASRYADDILMQRLITGQAQAANAAEIYSTSRVSDVANAFADAAANRLFPARGGGGSPVTGGYGAYDPNADPAGIATAAAISAIRDSNKTYSILPGLLAAGGASAIAGIISSPGARAAIVDGAFAVARNVSLAGRGMGVLAAAAGGGLLGAGAAGLGAIAGGGIFDAGLATTHGAAVTNFLGTWLPRIHYGIMATNEILATAGPAAAAAVAAGAVGLEGGQTAYTRLSAINTVGQSLGPALGQTPGQFLGLGNTLQKAQTLADPGVWALLGAAKAVVTGGGGGAFTQLGTNTIGMIDRFAAKVTTAFTSGGAGKQMSDLVSQGTQYLQQFGDVAANIGTTLLHVAPVLPGVGGDLLTTLQGATRGLSNLTGIMPPPLLGAILAGEAGGRYGPGLVGALGNYAGRVPGGFLGTTARLATADDIALGPAAPLAVSGLPAAEVGETIAGTGAAGALGSVGFLGMAGLGVAAYTVGKIITAKSPTQQWIGGLQNAVNQGNLTQDYGLLASDMTQYAGMSGGPQTVGAGQGMKNALGGKGYDNAKNFFQSMLASVLPGIPFVRTPAGDASAALQAAAGQFNNLLAAGPAIQGMLGGGSMQNAYAMADMAGLTGDQLQQLIHGTAKQQADIRSQLLNAQTGFKVMGSSPGVYGANVNAVQAMSGLAGTKLSTVNQSWDQIVSNATGGTASATGFAAGIGVIGALGKTPGVAQALTSFTSPASQQAWAAFSSPSTTTPGALQQAQSMADWMRTAMTVSQGKIGQGQYNEVTAYQAKQLLPYAKSSPAALAQLGVLSQEMSGPGYDPTKTQAQNYAAISKAIDSAAGSAATYNKNVNDATIATAGVSQQALNFGATLKENTYAALSGGASSLPQVATDRLNFLKSITGGSASAASMEALAQDFAAGGITGKDVGAVIPQMLAGKGLTSGQIGKITEQVTLDVSKAALPKLPPLHWQSVIDQPKLPSKSLQGGKIVYDTKVDPPKLPTPPKPNPILYTTRIPPAILPPNPVPRPIIIPEYIVRIGSASGITPAPLGGLTFAGAITRATGGMVPGFGSGDHVPALLEPGEAIVPKYLVPLIAPILRSHHVPGFAAGGIMGTAPHVPYATYEKFLPQYNAYKAQIKAEHKWYDSFDQWYAATQGAVKEGTIAATKATTSISAKATADANKIATEINYARSVSNASVSGLNIAGMSVDSPGSTGMGAVPPGHPGYNAAAWNAATTYAASNATPLPSVQDQMQSYLSSVKAFSGDLGVLGKKGLNKGILQQLIGAGPVQGDALAQSILGGAGGVGGVNKLFQQIQAASRHLGGTAAGAVYGGHPTTSGGAVSVGGINISVNVGGGGGSGGVSLSTAQIKIITEQVQAALLKQAKRNQKTGLKLSGYGA